MATHYESIHAPQGGGDWHGPLTDIGDQELGHGQYAIFLGGDEGVYVYGSSKQLAAWFVRIDNAIQAVIKDAERPLAMSDFVEDGGEWACPRCPAKFETAQHRTLMALVQKIDAHIVEHNDLRIESSTGKA